MRKNIIFISVLILLNIFICGQCVLGQNVLDQSVSTDAFLPNKMDFSTAIKYSLEHNNDIRAMKKGLSASEKDIGIAKSYMLPKAKFHENFTATNNPIEAFSFRLNQTVATPAHLSFGTLDYPGAVTNFLTSLALEQRILDRKAMIAIKMAKKEYSANGYIYLRKQEELAMRVAQAYLQVSTNEEFVKVAQQALDDVNKHLNTAEERYQNKIGLYSDILRGKSALQQREENLISAKKNLSVSKRNLGLLLGLETPVDISNSIPNINLQDINYYKNFSAYRNDIKATEIRVENAKNNIKSAQAEWYPTLSAVASYNFYQNNYPFGGQGNNYIAAAMFKWDIFDGNKRNYEISKAKDKEAEAKEYLEGLKKAVNFKVYEVYSNVEEHLRTLSLAIEAQKQAEEDVKLVENQWKNSEVPLVSLVDAQVNLNDARVKLVKNRFDLMEDLINLSYESGIIYQELAIK